MTKPELPPGMKWGPEIARIIATVSETGEAMGISVLSNAPRDVLVAALRLTLEQVEKLPPNASGNITVKATTPEEEHKKARFN